MDPPFTVPGPSSISENESNEDEDVEREEIDVRLSVLVVSLSLSVSRSCSASDDTVQDGGTRLGGTRGAKSLEGNPGPLVEKDPEREIAGAESFLPDHSRPPSVPVPSPNPKLILPNPGLGGGLGGAFTFPSTAPSLVNDPYNRADPGGLGV